jgi:(1->4)-alpha-D-glucan 1-alpha-D-glucosylmutase
VSGLRATYRLQLGPGLGFREARALVPYLRGLGVSHLYLSPSLQARRDSTHGYDVVDPTRISETLGGEEEFRRLCGAGLGVVLDIVPNHMATSEEENRFWADPALRRRFFDWDERTGWYRRFFDIGELGGVRVEDPEVFETTHRKVLELISDDLVDGLRIDHPDGLADPAGYLQRLRERGARRLWVEKILEPGEELRDWPVEGTTGYEFANDVTALFVDEVAVEPITRLWEQWSGEQRAFEVVAQEAKLEQARTTFAPEVARLRSLLDRPGLEEATAGLHVYRTYVEPWSRRVVDADRAALAGLPDAVRRPLLLEEPAPEEFVVRFQQTTGAVMAKGIEDTAFYRWFRLAALNEVGGDPGRFSLPVEEFHRANAERLERRPDQLLATTTHDTKRSGDVRARIAALSWFPDDWAERVRRWRELTGGLDDPAEEYLLWQTLVGAWPISAERVQAYMEKAMREGKRTTNWLRPDETHERRVREFVRGLYEHDRFRADFEPFVARVIDAGRLIGLGMTLLKLTVPGVPDIYRGDEVEYLALVDPDNRRPVDWDSLRQALDRPSPKLQVVRAALALRAERPGSFAGGYDPIDSGDAVCSFVRGGDVLVSVPLRPGAVVPAAESGWEDRLDRSLGVALRLRR